jgi:hypothetical protein
MPNPEGRCQIAAKPLNWGYGAIWQSSRGGYGGTRAKWERNSFTHTLPIAVVSQPAFLNAPGNDEIALPSTLRNEPLKFQICVVSGRRPDRKLFREGLQTPCWT